MTSAQRITLALGGHWYGHYGLTFCPAHQNTRTPALSLRDSEDGKLLAHCHAGCTFADIICALRELDLTGQSAPGPGGNLPRVIDAKPKPSANFRQALRCWDESRRISGSIAEVYLRTRAITCDLPKTLRFHPRCWHGPSATLLPAMVARVEGRDQTAVHRTFLRPDGRSKAAVSPVKMMLGATAGGAVCLVQADGPLVVAEGIETALSLACGMLAGPVSIWAALSATGMAKLHLPDLPGCLIVATDGDEVGRSAGHSLAERAQTLGWEVSILAAPDGRDWNDVLQLKGAI